MASAVTRTGLVATVCLLMLMGCGGSGGGGGTPNTPPPTSNNPPPSPPTIGAEGGTVTESSGASIVVPAGAIDSDTTFRIAMDSTGAPPMPTTLKAAGNMYVITPHGGLFARPVEVTIPVPNVTLSNNQEFRLAKAQPNGQWQVLDDSKVVDGKLTATVDSFSFFTSVIITYPLPILQAAPYQYDVSFTCGEQDCYQLIGPATFTFSVVGNGGQLQEPCVEGYLQAEELTTVQGVPTVQHSRKLPLSGGSWTRTVPASDAYGFTVSRWCNLTAGSDSYIFFGSWRNWFHWQMLPNDSTYPTLSVVRMPAQLDVVEGAQASVDAYLLGGALRGSPEILPTASDHAIVDWLRSDNGGASWRIIARSFQHEANPQPYGTGNLWVPWSVRHEFVATAVDQNALIRVNACYTPPAPTAPPPCVTGAATRINVLQQSALPAIVEQPRSVLIRSAETANFSVTVSGLPAPTLQWQMRPANSTGEWTNVDVGSGATTANYTTAPRALSNNGEQYRVVATNALSSATSLPVTLSVSDLDVAPSITTQPAALSVANGGDAVFAIVAHGTEALSYQWLVNGSNIAGANSPVLRLTAVTAANAGNYSVIVSNNAGTATSNDAPLNVTAGTPAAVAPNIVTQPSGATVNLGNTATFAVGVDGSGPFSFQWRRDGVNIAGATSAVLTFNSVALSNAGSYSVRVRNSAGEVTSDAVLLDVTEADTPVAPIITSQPATLIVPLGGSSTMAVGATGSGPLSYQWYLDGNPLPGSTLPVLNFATLGSVDFGTYTVTVTNSLGSVTSEPADLILLGAPVITQQPAAASVLEGENATFFVRASGSGLRYQWFQNGSPIPGAIAATFNTPSLVAANSGAVYSVLVYNGAGHVFSQGAVLTVQILVAPSIISHPASSTIEPGAQAEMCVTIGGTPRFDVQLQRWNGSTWSGGPDVGVNQNTSVCYFTDPLTLAETGAQFRFFIRNLAGQVVSNTATVTVQAPPTGITQTTLASRATNGATANNRSYDPTLSADGNLVAFYSDGTNLVPGFTGNRHGYVRNLLTGVTTVVNQTPAGTESSQRILQMKLAAGGRYVVFSSLADDLVADDSNGSMDVFLRDLQTGTTERLSVLQDGSQLTGAGNGVGDMRLDISADGRYVIFASQYDFSSAGAELPQISLFLRDTQTDQTRIVVANPSYSVGYAALSSGGGYIAYALSIGNPVPAPVQVYDIGTSTTATLFTLDQSTNVDYLGKGLSISGNGRYVAFALRSQPLLGSTVPQVVVIDRNDPATLMIGSIGSIGSGIGAGDGESSYPKLSDDGLSVVFSSKASNISGNVGNSLDWTLMSRDLQTQITTVASRRADGTPVRTAGDGDNLNAISGDGSVVGFTAYQTDMGDGNIDYQVYVAPRP